MILVDANLLVYAHVRSTPEHTTAKFWLDTQLTGPGRVGLPWPSLLAFVRIVHGLTVFSSDGDFARFAGLRWINPLVS